MFPVLFGQVKLGTLSILGNKLVSHKCLHLSNLTTQTSVTRDGGFVTVGSEPYCSEARDVHKETTVVL